MKTILSAALIALVSGSAAVAAIQPIPGSITYDNANVQLKKAPAGSPLFHKFTNGGNEYRETYVVSPDKSLKLVDRIEINND